MNDKQAGPDNNAQMPGSHEAGISTRRTAPQAGDDYEMPPEDRPGSPQQHVEGAGDSAGEGLGRFQKD